MRDKVLHVTTVHRFPDNRIFYKECRALSNAGYDVTVLLCGDYGKIQF